MLVSDINDMRKYLPSIMMKTAGSTVINDAIYAADTWVRSFITGQEAYDTALKAEEEDGLRTVMSRAVALTAFLSVMADLDLALTDAGFSVIQDNQMVPASRARVEKLEKSLRLRRLETLSELVSRLRQDALWRLTSQARWCCRSLAATVEEMRSFIPGVVLPDWETFSAMQERMCTAQMYNLPSWVPLPFILEITGKYTAAELNAQEEAVAGMLARSAGAFAAGGDGSTWAVKARAFIKANPDLFPGFSDPLGEVPQNNESSIVNML